MTSIYASALKTRMEKISPRDSDNMLIYLIWLKKKKKECICITRTWSGKVIRHRRIHMNTVKWNRTATCGINQYQVQNSFLNILVWMKVFIGLHKAVLLLCSLPLEG